MSTKDNYIDMKAQSGLELCRHRLDSWKELAVYLDREVRTVQRWEKNEALPVHRHIHLKGGTVYALKEEINVWLTARGQTSSKSRPIQTGARQAANDSNPPPRVNRQMLSAFGLWLVVVGNDPHQDNDDLGLADARIASVDSHYLNSTQRPKSKRKARPRQLVTHRESRPLSLAVRPGCNYPPGNIGRFRRDHDQECEPL